MIGGICEAAFLTRLKQLSLFFPLFIPSHSLLMDKMNQTVRKIQQDQLDVDSTYLSYGNFEQMQAKFYSFGTNGKVDYETLKLNTIIYNFITVSSSVVGSPVFIYNFPLQVLTSVNPPDGAILLFVTIYNTLYEILPS